MFFLIFCGFLFFLSFFHIQKQEISKENFLYDLSRLQKIENVIEKKDREFKKCFCIFDKLKGWKCFPNTLLYVVLNIQNSQLNIDFPRNEKSRKKYVHSNEKKRVPNDKNENDDFSTDDDDNILKPNNEMNYKKICILEVGSRKGENSILLGKLSSKFDINGLDINKDYYAYAQAQSILHNVVDRVNFIKGDITSPPSELWKKQYDVIFSIGSSSTILHEKNDKERFLFFCKERLKDDGKLILIDIFNSNPYNDVHEKVLDIAKKWYFYDKKEYSSLNDWMVMFDQHNLCVEESLPLSQECNNYSLSLWKCIRFIFSILPDNSILLFCNTFPQYFYFCIKLLLFQYMIKNKAFEYKYILISNKRKNIDISKTKK